METGSVKRTIKTILVTVAIMLLVNCAVFIPRMVILSNLEYKRSFINSMYVMRVGKTTPQFELGFCLEVSKYNAWLSRMKWLREQGLSIWVPYEIEKEEYYQP